MQMENSKWGGCLFERAVGPLLQDDGRFIEHARIHPFSMAVQARKPMTMCPVIANSNRFID